MNNCDLFEVHIFRGGHYDYMTQAPKNLATPLFPPCYQFNPSPLRRCYTVRRQIHHHICTNNCTIRESAFGLESRRMAEMVRLINAKVSRPVIFRPYKRSWSDQLITVKLLHSWICQYLIKTQHNGDMRLLTYGAVNNIGTLSPLTTCVTFQTPLRDGRQRSLRHSSNLP